MTCPQVLEQLLEAEPEELAGRGTSAVALHVQECERCRSVAGQLLGDTRLLADAVHRGAVVRRPSAALIVAGLAAAATLTFVMVPERGGDAPVVIVPAVPVVVTPPPPVMEVPASRGEPSVPSANQSHLRPFAAATPVAPILIPNATPGLSSASDSPSRFVAVDPPPGKQAAIMKTSDPTITVVWLY